MPTPEQIEDMRNLDEQMEAARKHFRKTNLFDLVTHRDCYKHSKELLDQMECLRAELADKQKYILSLERSHQQVRCDFLKKIQLADVHQEVQRRTRKEVLEEAIAMMQEMLECYEADGSADA